MKPPTHDVLGTPPGAFVDMMYPDASTLAVLLASVRFGCGLELWSEAPARKGVQRAALS